MKLGPAPKRYTVDGHRTIPPSETLRRVEPLSGVIGLTCLEDLTDKDRLGIPVFSCVRSTTEPGAVDVHNGKGASREQAKASMLMEALERYSAEMRGADIMRRMVDEMLLSSNAVDPLSLILPEMAAYHVRYHPLGWVKGFEIFEGEEIWVPASAVFHPYNSRHDFPIFRSNTNGLASGNTLEEAVLHGLCEVIERDAWSICEYRKRVNSRIDPCSDHPIISDLVSKFHKGGVELHLSDLTSDIGIPTIAAAADDTTLRDPSLLMIGVGTHLNPDIAIIRAITEVAQSRATHLFRVERGSAGPEWSKRIGYERMKRINQMWLSEEVESKPLDTLPYLDTSDLYEDIQVILERLHAKGLKQVIAVDLTKEELAVPVVRIIVPGLEVYTMDDQRIGARLQGDPD